MSRRTRQLHKVRLSRLGKRVTALALALSMVVPGFAAFGYDMGDFINPHKLVENDEEPTINIELNAVVDHDLGDNPSKELIEASLTGELEVVLRVKTGIITTTEVVEGETVTTVDPQLFNNIEVALEYSHLLTPASFSGVEVRGINSTIAAPGDSPLVNMVNMETLKVNKLLATMAGQVSTKETATVNIGTEEAPEYVTTPSGGGYLVLAATAGRPLELDEEGGAVLGAVTFTYDLGEVKPVFMQGNDYFTRGSLAWLMDLVQASVFFDADGEQVTDGMAQRELTYNSAYNSMYYSYAGTLDGEKYFIDDDTDPDLFEPLTDAEAAAVSDSVKVPKLGRFAVDPDFPNDHTKASRLFNLLKRNPAPTIADPDIRPNIVEHQINFTLVNKVSYDPAKSGGDGVIIEFFDWDDTQIGALTVPKDKDAREAVNNYVRTHFIHPDLRIQSTDADAADKVKSLTREDTYRGKYPTTAMSEEDAVGDPTIDLTGVDYKLTNKLDYVFFKRPMGHEGDAPDPTTYAVGDYATDGTLNPDYKAAHAAWQAKWVQQSTTTSGEGGAEDTTTANWDIAYPYIYGWAMTDLDTVFDKDKTMWTTIGMGELADYNASSSGGYNASFVDGTPTELTVDQEDFQFADFNFGAEGNSQVTGSVYAVKAVYEPGISLMQSAFNYRMLSNPAYNKLNEKAASEGGAYSVTVNLERSVIYSADSKLYGIARIREPAIRQQTTPDLLWEENGDLGVEHNLPSATHEEAADLMTKTTYTKVTVNNSDVVEIELTLSARQNKVDYFLIDMFGNSFVSGGQRSAGNLSFYSDAAEDFTLDNYNYYVAGESEVRDSAGYYFDVTRFDDKDGSRGFVLYGTLNNLMQKASQYNAGEITQSQYNTYVTLGVLGDANLRTDSAGNEPTILNLSTMRTTILNAAQKCRDDHYGDADYWDSTLDCAQLTYHQLQLFINTGNLYSRAAADANSIGWCHLHAACAATSSGKPTTWAELIAAASGSSSDQDNISLLTANEVEKFFHLRSDAVGTQFTTSADFQTAVVAAVAAIGATADWDQVQDYIIRGAGYDSTGAYSKATYWWYDGGEKPTDLAGVLAAAATANSTGRTAALNTIESAFNKMKTAATDDAANRAEWINLTENLATEGTDGTLDATFADFSTRLRTAVTALGTSVDWGDIQYHILNSASPSHPADDAEIAGYWWHYGVQKVVDLPTLLAAADHANNGRTGALDAVNLTFLEDTLFLRGSVTGKKFGDLDTPLSLSEVKEKIKTAVATGGTSLTWNTVQFYLIHDDLAASYVDTEAQYYWWKTDGVTGTSFTFSAGTKPSTATVVNLLSGVFRKEYFGDPGLDAALSTAANVFSCLRLVASTTASPTTTADLTQFGSLDDFSTAVKAAIEAYRTAESDTDPYTIPYLTWYQIQYSILNSGAYVATTDTATYGPLSTDYWWYEKDSLVSDPTVQLVAAIETYLNGARTATDLNLLKNTLTVAKLNTTYFIRKTAAGATWAASPPAANLNAAKTKLGNLAAALATSAYYDSGTVTLTWAQIQYWFLYATLVDPDTAIQIIAWPSSAIAGGLNWDALGRIPSGVVVPPYTLSLGLMPLGTVSLMTESGENSLAVRMTELAGNADAISALSEEERDQLATAALALLAALEEKTASAEVADSGPAGDKAYSIDPDTVIVDTDFDQDRDAPDAEAPVTEVDPDSDTAEMEAGADDGDPADSDAAIMAANPATDADNALAETPTLPESKLGSDDSVAPGETDDPPDFSGDDLSAAPAPDPDPPDDTGQTTDVIEFPGDSAGTQTTQQEGEPQMSTTIETNNLTGTVWPKDIVRCLAEGRSGSTTVVVRRSVREEAAK